MRFTYGTDLHGIEQSKKVVASFLAHVKDFKPQLKVFGGDLWNFAALRRQADEYEKNIRLKEDFKAGLEFLNEYRPAVFILGNHDQRLWDGVKRERVHRTGWISELCETYLTQFHDFADKLKIRVLPYDKFKGVYHHNGLAFAHGFGAGESLTQKMAETYGDVLIGHGHRIERSPAICAGQPVVGYQCGCLCRKNMEYARADLGALRHENGWAYGVLGRVNEVFQARFKNGQALVADGLKAV